jgi:hypothetical protein
MQQRRKATLVKTGQLVRNFIMDAIFEQHMSAHLIDMLHDVHIRDMLHDLKLFFRKVRFSVEFCHCPDVVQRLLTTG